MPRMSRLLSAVCLGIAATAGLAAGSTAVEYAPVHRMPLDPAESAQAARIVVKYKPGASTLAATSSSGSRAGIQSASVMAGRLGVALTAGRSLGPRTQVLTASGLSSTALAAAVGQDAEVEWVEVDRRAYIQAAPNDPLYPGSLSTTVATNGPANGQWYLRAPDSVVKSGINIEPAWAITTGSSAIVIADVDTGITSHPDLDSKILPGYDFVTEVPTANDSNGRDSNPSDPGDWVTGAENSKAGGEFFGCNDNGKGGNVGSSSSWHGTQTAGILGAATNNGTGMAGTAYNTMIIPARALGKCGGFESDIVAAAEWAAGVGGAQAGVSTVNAHPARVINMSLGGTKACSNTYQEGLTLLRNAGVVVVAAAGNGNGAVVATPANCKPAASDPDQTPIVIAVAAVRHAGTKVGFSDIGPEVTLSAPGGNCVNTDSSLACEYPILTTSNTGTTTPVVGGGTYSTSFGEISLGTSFSTPMVSGTVALMLSAAPQLTNAQIVQILKSTANPFPTASDTTPQPPACTVPTPAIAATGSSPAIPASPEQDECICTAQTCGAGMLNAGAAVAAAVTAPRLAPLAVISGDSTVAAGATLLLSGASSAPKDGSSLTSYAWTISSGSSFASLSSNTGSSVALTGVAAGTAVVQLTVTDASGATSSTTSSVTVTTSSSSSSGNGGSGGGGGGGGATSPLWLLALACAGMLLTPRKRAGRVPLTVTADRDR
jgi:serine protease